jgi:hypothetical protein
VQATLQLQRLRDTAILGMDELSPDKAGGGARAEDPALPVAAVPRRRGVHRLAAHVLLKETIRGR